MQAATIATSSQIFVPAGEIVQGRNPRTYFDETEMNELIASVKAQGVLQSLLLRPLEDGKFQIIAGERRWRAAMKAHGPEYQIPALIREMSDEEADEASLIENIQRANMAPTEEAAAAAKILVNCEGDRNEAARRLGWTRATLDKRLALMNCHETIRTALNERKILLGHAELIAGLAKEKQPMVLEMLLKATELPSVAELKGQIEKMANGLASAIFDKKDCAGCVHNSGNQQALFGEAISDGHCTNRSCFEEKTEAALLAKKESLKDEYPEIRIVRPGENFTVIKLVAEGATGVGEDQAKACLTCKNYGAAISAVPGKIGNVYTKLCFDSSCNAAKVKEQQEAQAKAAKAAEVAAKEAKGKTEGGKPTAATSGEKTTTPKAAPSVQDPNRVKEYRVKIWRSALLHHLVKPENKQDNLYVLLTLAMTGNVRHANGSKMVTAFEKITGENCGSDPVKIFEALKGKDEVVLTKMQTLIAASSAEHIEEHLLVKLLTALNVKIEDYWSLCKEYLELLTKSEIEAVAEQIGLKAHADKQFAKIMASKKDEIVKQILTVEGFEYAGKVPANMRFLKA